MEYKKDFDGWNREKKNLDVKEDLFANVREIWWCAVGVNVGVEIDGKNDNFERPVLILKVYNKNMVLAVPLSSKKKDNPYYFEILLEDGLLSYAILSQARLVSSKRFVRKIGRLREDLFDLVITAYKNHI